MKGGAMDFTSAEGARFPTLDAHDPADRILAAAFAILARDGLTRATVRRITQLAGVNVAAVNYYFRSRDELVRQVLDRAAAPYVVVRLQSLAACEARGCGPKLEQILDALVRPTVIMTRTEDGSRPLVALLMQVRAQPSEATQRFFTGLMDPAADRFVAALGKALPKLTHAELLWRYNFALGSVMHVLTDAAPQSRRLLRQSNGECDTNDNEAIIRELIAFLAGAFRAPGSGGAKRVPLP
jgi:AcrR family transcriptional regulator